MQVINYLLALTLFAPIDDKVGVTAVISNEQERNFGIGHTGANADYIQQLRNAVLPVTLTDFSLLKSDRFVALKWTTVSEFNNSHFILKRSADGLNYEEIARIEGKGNSSSVSNYQYLDRIPLSGQNYYKLEQVDYNGSKYSFKVLATNYQLATQKVYAYFSAEGYLNTSINTGKPKDKAVISILNPSGQLLKQVNLNINQGVTQYSFDDILLAAGVYVVSVRLVDETIVQKVIK